MKLAVRSVVVLGFSPTEYAITALPTPSVLENDIHDGISVICQATCLSAKFVTVPEVAKFQSVMNIASCKRL